MATNYVGVSGVSSVEQQVRIVEAASEAKLFETDYRLYLGVKAMPWTQGEGRPDDHGELWYPSPEGLARAIRIARSFGGKEDNWHYKTEDFNTVPIVQLYLGEMARDAEARKQFVELVMGRTTEWVRYDNSPVRDSNRSIAIQLDMFPWMNPTTDDFLRWLTEKSSYPVVLQCFKDYMEVYQPYEIVKRLRRLGEEVSGISILFDASHGKGVSMDAGQLRPYIGTMKESVVGDFVDIGVAGGLDDKNVEQLLMPLLREFGPLSWDAESKLHFGDGLENGDFRGGVLQDYIRASSRLAHKVSMDIRHGQH